MTILSTLLAVTPSSITKEVVISLTTTKINMTKISVEVSIIIFFIVSDIYDIDGN
jgi:hypothetical protein